MQNAVTHREAVISVLGAPPDPAPLNPTVLDVVEQGDFRREHIKYAVSPNDSAYAYLLLPRNITAPVPVVFAHHRYTGNFAHGKSEIVGLEGEPNYAFGLELVKRGFAVFAPDVIGFGERRPADSSAGTTTGATQTSDSAYRLHQLALRLLRGETLLKKTLWDISRGVDYLETRRDELNMRRLGFMGCHFGGTMAIWAAALEPRIAVTVAHCGILTHREQIRQGDWSLAEFIVPRLQQVAELHHIIELIAPRPCLLSVSKDDPQSVDAADVFKRSLPMYERLGGGNRLTLYTYPGMEFTPHIRHNVYNWLENWLLPY
jgi:dienelactone hydrolase